MKYLGEHEFGFDTGRIGFPSISGCRAIVYQTTAGLFGYHNAGGNWARDWKERSDEFRDYVKTHTQGKSKGMQVYVVGYTKQPQTGYSCVADWMGEAKAFAKSLKFKGPRSGFDLSTKFQNDRSCLVEYRRAGNSSILMACPWDDHLAVNKSPKGDTALKSDRPDHLMRGGRAARTVRVDCERKGLEKLELVRLN